MISPMKNNKKFMRRSFGIVEQIASIPNLIEVQKNSYKLFLQANIPANERLNIGLQNVINSVFPIEDFNGIATLEALDYSLEEPKYDVEEAKQRGVTYSSLLKATLRLIVKEIDEDTGVKEIKSIKEQDVYIGDIPMMTENGTFIINGTERVVVSQMHRSPGVFFDHDKGKTHSSGKYLYSARIIPYRGSWLDFEFDVRDLLYFRIDRKRKLLVSTLLRAFGYSTKDILNTFYKKLAFIKLDDGWSTDFIAENYKGIKLNKPIIDSKTRKIIVEEGVKITPRLYKKLLNEKIEKEYIPFADIKGRYLSEDIIDELTGEVILSCGDEIQDEHIEYLKTSTKVKGINILNIDNISSGPYIRNTLLADKNLTEEEAVFEIYRVVRSGESPTFESAKEFLTSLFFNADRYDLSSVGRVKLNSRLNLNFDEELKVLTIEDIIAIIKELLLIKDGNGFIDDIDHLGNRRVRSVGELVENQFRIGMVRIQKAVLERIANVDIDTVMPHDLVNAKLLVSVIKEFFGTSQLSQFMDQTNPLSEITHKRRLSALGPGGLTRDRAGFEVRDVHTSHYGRICPIETPEGQNIGLINSMATFARVDKYGFIESPYRRVIDGKITDEVVYLSAIEEGKYIIAQANAEIDAEGYFINELISCRHKGDFIMSTKDSINYIDVSPMQLVSVAASLIPFLENDDANRALMGSNMQRQAVPLIHSEAPLIGTGIENVVAKDSGAVVIAKRSGIVDKIDGDRIVIRCDIEAGDNSLGVDIYNLLKFKRSNHNTCINQKSLVKVGDRINKGDVIADGPSTSKGELALGSNVLVAFMPWNGYNFEDSILISERVVRDDVFTSIHIEEFEVVARDTRLGPEEITRDIPNVGEENLRHLDEVGIVHVGAEVKSGDILVGKVTPKSESPMTAEEKLLRAIFGEKASDMRDTSLRLPPGVVGTIVEVKVFTRRGVEKDQRALAIERQEITSLEKNKNDELAIISNYVFAKLENLLLNNEIISGPKGFKLGSQLTKESLSDFSHGQWWQFTFKDEKINQEIIELKEHFDKDHDRLNKWFLNKVEKLKSGDDLPQGALKVVKVFVAIKHKLQPGDKMAGRHGNKGVISKIMPVEDMPYLEDGTVIDVVLSPLGVPSRMNIGQILETHLGWASVNLGNQIKDLLSKMQYDQTKLDQLRNKLVDIYDDKTFLTMPEEELIQLSKKVVKGVPFATPVFDGAREADINKMLELAALDTSGQVTLIDGKTGEYFDRKVTIGSLYMLKLHHLVDDKIHARSIGPYSLVTQQPLGGKSHFGGQRFGEMECWALQAYGAAYTLQEMLTVKSDDVSGRIKMYESIVRGDNQFESGIPESFHVMVKELRSLCLNVELEQSE